MERINNRYTRDMKTAVEWFALELYEKFEMKGDGNLFDDLLEQAKEIEISQKAEEYLKGFKDGKEYEIKLNELTFKSK